MRARKRWDVDVDNDVTDIVLEKEVVEVVVVVDDGVVVVVVMEETATLLYK